MPQAVERIGRPAAPGTAAGPLVRLAAPAVRRVPSGVASRERADLETSIAAAIRSLENLASSVDGDAAAMLEFQIAMLEDTVLSDPAMTRIAAGADAVSAWTEVIALQISDYQATEDEYFRARAADLADLRDRVLRHLSGEDETTVPVGAVLVGEEITPSRFLAADWSKGGGIALSGGSPSSHVAMLARSRGVPMVVGLGAFETDRHRTAILDGDAGRLVLSPAAADWSVYEAARAAGAGLRALEAAAAPLPARTADGVSVKVMINVAEPDELASLDPAICDGIGLVRTEFLFHRGDRTSRRGDPIRRLPPHRRLGRRDVPSCSAPSTLAATSRSPA